MAFHRLGVLTLVSVRLRERKVGVHPYAAGQVEEDRLAFAGEEVGVETAQGPAQGPAGNLGREGTIQEERYMACWGNLALEALEALEGSLEVRTAGHTDCSIRGKVAAEEDTREVPGGGAAGTGSAEVDVEVRVEVEHGERLGEGLVVTGTVKG